MKKLWYRLILWHNNFCPKHGQQTYFVRGFWCPMCYVGVRFSALQDKADFVLGRTQK